MYQQEQRIVFQMKAYEWIMLTEAIDAYVDKFDNLADMNELIEFADYIDSRLKIGNYYKRM